MSTHTRAGSPWQRRPDAQRLRWADGTQLESLRALVEEAETAWRAAWGIAAAAPVRCTSMHEARSRPDLQPLAQASNAAAWIGWIHEQEVDLFPGAPGTPLVAAARAASRRDREQRLRQALGMPSAPFGAGSAPVAAGRWSGAARALLACGSELVVDAGGLAALGKRVAAPAPEPKPLAAMALAAMHRRVRVQARLADCTLDVGGLQGLQPGDVVRLDHPLSTPLAVHVSGGALLFSGFLAARAGCKAVELAGIAPSLYHTEVTP